MQGLRSGRRVLVVLALIAPLEAEAALVVLALWLLPLAAVGLGVLLGVAWARLRWRTREELRRPCGRVSERAGLSSATPTREVANISIC